MLRKAVTCNPSTLSRLRFRCTPPNFRPEWRLTTRVLGEPLDAVIFFWDPLTTQPHGVDVKALLHLPVLHNVPIACNRASADFLITSPLFFDRAYHAQRGPVYLRNHTV